MNELTQKNAELGRFLFCERYTLQPVKNALYIAEGQDLKRGAVVDVNGVLVGTNSLVPYAVLENDCDTRAKGAFASVFVKGEFNFDKLFFADGLSKEDLDNIVYNGSGIGIVIKPYNFSLDFSPKSNEYENIIPDEASSSNKLATSAEVAEINTKIPPNTSTTNKLVNESGLQDAIDNASESWSTGFTPKGESSVSDLNDLTTQSNGDSYIVTDSGTLTDGTLVVVAGDQVAWDATNSVWYKLPQYATKEFSDGIKYGQDILYDVVDPILAEPINKIDPSKLTEGRYLWDGSYQSNSSYVTTDYIPVKNGDVIRFYFKNSGGVPERTSGERAALFDKDKNYIGVTGQHPFVASTGYVIDDASVKYIRASYEATFTTVELTVNVYPLITKITEYFNPYFYSKRVEGSNVKKIIDCWGDSLTEVDIGTSYPEYLATMLGDPFIVTNRGMSGQASGQVGFRFGSNEVFVTLENNKIPASGSVNITGIISSVGSREGYNLETASNNRGSRCTLNGVPGVFIWHRNNPRTFTRDYAGDEVRVVPGTKLIPEPYFEGSHMQILWVGKNDFYSAYPYVLSGVEDNYDAMVQKIPHDKFILLGVTYSHGDSYDVGGSDRTGVDHINGYLEANYHENFIDINKELVENGLTLEGITPTEQDEADIAKGWIPSSLMSDPTHPNQYGREAIAKIIYAWMQSKGWV